MTIAIAVNNILATTTTLTRIAFIVANEWQGHGIYIAQARNPKCELSVQVARPTSEQLES